MDAQKPNIIQWIIFIVLAVGLFFFLFQLDKNNPASAFVCEKGTLSSGIENVICEPIDK